MNHPPPKLVLLPGLDGTGNLLNNFVLELQESIVVETISYPTDRCLSIPELASSVKSVLPVSEPFVLMGESFSSLVAICCAAESFPNLKGLVLCAGFVTSPLHGWRRTLATYLPSTLFRFKLPKFVARRALVGPDASASLLDDVRSVISSVRPQVLSGRLLAILDSDVCAKLIKIKVPILYLQATHDCLVGPASLDEMRRIVPNVAVVSIPGPHLLLQKEPKLTAGIVTNFVRGLT